ncbi:MAG: hypothetical protein D8M58_08730 [Calditrichaeota bacterium]|nr:MAG: hypothetical protein DWQ03_17760 [Calditrichota bacterium]MBL1205468.1 hypothetical protein [Calditrichota bacterium]NOG45297.1 hypothetical protein [Calditrichota bacterium]
MIYRIVVLLTLGILYSCSNVDPNEDPNPLYGTDNRYGSFVQDTIYAQADTVIRANFEHTGLTSKLSLGEFDGLSAGFEIKFNGLPHDSISVDSVFLKFTTLNSFGPNAFDFINGTMYTIIDSFDTDSINTGMRWRDPLNPQYVDEGTSRQVSFNLKDSSETSLDLSMEVFNGWRTGTLENYGLYFHPLEEDVIVELGSFNSSLDPLLVYYTHIEDSVVKDTLYPETDGTIFNYDENGTALLKEADKIFVSSGVISKSFLKFNFDNIPDKAIMYSANIVLTEDDSNPVENPENSTSFFLKPLEEIVSDLDEIEFNPNITFSLTSDAGITDVLGAHKNSLSIDVVQEIRNGSVNSEWFQVDFSSDNDELSIKRFWGVNADKSVSPKMIVKYLNAKK